MTPVPPPEWSRRTPAERLRPSGRARAAFVAAACAAALATLAGCTLAPKPPAVTAVEPAWGYNGETTAIEILGAHFFPTVIVSDAEDEGGRIEGTFEAWLDGGEEPLRLSGVQHLSYERLGADVPPGIDPGVYDLRVEVPTGLTAVLPGAFTVTDTRADHLEIEMDDVAYEVGNYADVAVLLKDPEDKAVAQSVEVEIVATPASEDDSVADVVFAPDMLGNQVPLEDAVGVRGFLDVDGTGRVFVTSRSESTVRLKVVPVDDGVVRGTEQTVAWDPGPVQNVVLELPQDPFETIAGTSFDLVIRLEDAFGNVLTGEAADVRLLDGCDTSLDEFVQVIGETTVPVTLQKACAEDRLYARYGGVTYESEPFPVHPAELAGYTVESFRDTVVAGDLVLLLVEAVDAYGNLIEDHEAVLTPDVDIGGLSPESSCTSFGSGVWGCTVSLWKAAPEVVVQVRDEGEGYGESPPIEVVPAAADAVVVVVAGDEVEAGQDFEVVVRVLDVYDNSLSYDAGGTEFEDASGTIGCRPLGAVPGAQRFACAITAAVEDAEVRARVFGIWGGAEDTLVVTNGPLAFVQLEPLTASFTAGTAFTLEMQGYDVYGNPYVVQSDPTVLLEASTGSMTPGSVTLDAEGAVQVTSVLYGAGEDVRVYASQGGLRIGASRPLVVAAAGIDGIAVDAPPWIDVDQPGTVLLSAVDAYGNVVGSYSGEVTVEARGGSCDDVTVDTFSVGTARVSLPCDTPTLGEAIVALDDDGFGGESGTFDVVDLACADGPVAQLTVDGEESTLRCVSEDGTVEVVADTSGSTARGEPIAARHFVDGEDVEERTVSPTLDLVYDGPGVRRVQTLIVDEDACGDIADALVYVGLDDGEPTGPVEVAVSDATPSSGDEITVTVGAKDCTGDLAAGQDVVVRADLGTPDGTGSGAGLLVPLDAVGEGSFTWSFDTGHAGTATLYVSSVGGGAFGSETVEVDGDSALPELVSIDPAGRELGTIDEVRLVFNEPMRAYNVTATNYALSGPDGAIGTTLVLSDDAETVTIIPDHPLDGSAGTYTVSLSTNARDAGGANQLDGGWTDTPAALVLVFGDVGEDLPTVSSCEADHSRFTPDGDDGEDAEADVVTVTPTATAAPEWWWMMVLAPDGSRVRSSRAPGSAGEIAWDGRDDDGMVTSAGAYRLLVRAIDGYGNVGGACNVMVELEQHVEPR